jgi:hypothetical protein
MTDLIALTSERGRSGKDTLCDLLVLEGYKVHRVAFGDVLKKQCSRMLALDECERIVMESHCHTDLKDAQFEELAIEAIPESEYKDWLLSEPQILDIEIPRTPRWHLQQYGTGFRRNYKANPDVWLLEGLKEIKKAPKDALVVVTDMRQANEYAALSIRQAHLVRLSRDWAIPAVDDVPLHATDIELRDFQMDAHVVNQWGHASQMIDQLRQQGVITHA